MSKTYVVLVVAQTKWFSQYLCQQFCLFFSRIFGFFKKFRIFSSRLLEFFLESFGFLPESLWISDLNLMDVFLKVFGFFQILFYFVPFFFENNFSEKKNKMPISTVWPGCCGAQPGCRRLGSSSSAGHDGHDGLCMIWWSSSSGHDDVIIFSYKVPPDLWLRIWSCIDVLCINGCTDSLKYDDDITLIIFVIINLAGLCKKR